jgi:hypothetical protein
MRRSILLLGIISAVTVGCGGSSASDGAGGHSPTNGGSGSNSGSSSAGGAGSSTGGVAGSSTAGRGGAASGGTGGTGAHAGNVAQGGSSAGASAAGGVGGIQGGNAGTGNGGKGGMSGGGGRSGMGGGGTGGGGTSGGGTSGGGTSGMGGGGMGGGGTGGIGASCGEPSACEGYDNQASVVAVISCLSPSSTAANTPLTLDIFGHHLAATANMNAVVTVGSGTPLNGVPLSACHLRVQLPANQIASPKQAQVVVSPGGFIQNSLPALLTVQ